MNHQTILRPLQNQSSFSFLNLFRNFPFGGCTCGFAFTLHSSLLIPRAQHCFREFLFLCKKEQKSKMRIFGRWPCNNRRKYSVFQIETVHFLIRLNYMTNTWICQYDCRRFYFFGSFQVFMEKKRRKASNQAVFSNKIWTLFWSFMTCIFSFLTFFISNFVKNFILFHNAEFK